MIRANDGGRIGRVYECLIRANDGGRIGRVYECQCYEETERFKTFLRVFNLGLFICVLTVILCQKNKLFMGIGEFWRG